MKREDITVRVDATYHLTVQAGDAVKRGQRLCEAPETETNSICPASGVIRSIRFDAERHEFVVSLAEAGTE
jgi:Na+-translocating ferredoxin:NAD+ oxidoreductase RnfC subunit